MSHLNKTNLIQISNQYLTIITNPLSPKQGNSPSMLFLTSWVLIGKKILTIVGPIILCLSISLPNNHSFSPTMFLNSKLVSLSSQGPKSPRRMCLDTNPKGDMKVNNGDD